VSIRISHPTLDPDEISEALTAVPDIAQRPGESRVQFGDCESAGYWVIKYHVEYPDRPDLLFLWAEEFVSDRLDVFRSMLDKEYKIDVYVGIHSTVVACGFMLPATPTIWKLGIPVGVEFFSGGGSGPLK